VIDELTDRMIQPEPSIATVAQGDVVIWDNRCSYHKRGDYLPEQDRTTGASRSKERLSSLPAARISSASNGGDRDRISRCHPGALKRLACPRVVRANMRGSSPRTPSR